MTTEHTTAYAVTASEYKGTPRIVAVLTDEDEARRLRAAGERSDPDTAYEVVSVPFVTHLPQVQPLYQWEAMISPAGRISYAEFKRTNGAYAFGFPGLNFHPAAGEIQVEDIAGGTHGTKSILARGWDRDEVEIRIIQEAERIQSELAEQAANRPPWACPTCSSLQVLFVTAPRRVTNGTATRFGLAPATQQRLRCDNGHTYPIPGGLEIDGI